MNYFFERLRPRIYEPRASEVKAAKTSLTTTPYLPKNVDITFFYGGHSNQRDFAALSPYMKGIDIFVPELTYWTLDQIKLFSRISQGDRSAKKQLALTSPSGKLSQFDNSEVDALLNSQIRVTSIDYSAEQERAAEIVTHFMNWGILDKVVPNWNKTLDNIIDYARKEAELEQHRENMMVASIGPRLQTLIDEDPELRKKARPKILIQQGLAHKGIFDRLSALTTEADSTAVFQVFDVKIKEQIPEHFDQLSETFKTGSPQMTLEKRRELAARVLGRTALKLEAIPFVIYETDYHNGKLILPSPEEMTQRLNINDIKKFHRQIVEAQRK